MVHSGGMVERIARYRVFEKIASGGHATVHFARFDGPLGFGRTVAVKRLHPHLATDSALALTLLDEARLVGCIRSPFVVPIVDVVSEGDELLVVMEYVLGETLCGVARRGGLPADPSVVAAIMVNVLRGLHAAHEATGRDGAPLQLVHRDVSPQNIIVSVDGVARVLDFGVAKAVGRLQTTRNGAVKGKLAYMSPEQMRAEDVDRRTDIFAASIVFWELLTGERLFAGDEASIIGQIVSGAPRPPSSGRLGLDAAVDAIVLRGLARDRDARFPTALAMASAIEATIPLASASSVAAWLENVVRDKLDQRRCQLRAIERDMLTTATAAEHEATRQMDVTRSAHDLSMVRVEPGHRAPRLAVALLAFGGALVAVGATAAAIGIRPHAAAAAEVVDARSVQPGEPPGPIVLPEAQEIVPDATGTVATPARPQHAPPRARPPSGTVATPDCSNPYLFDAQGRKRYRRECLQP
jgi:eukaryotic-like serine/threonine-protein kinase